MEGNGGTTLVTPAPTAMIHAWGGLITAEKDPMENIPGHVCKHGIHIHKSLAINLNM